MEQRLIEAVRKGILSEYDMAVIIACLHIVKDMPINSDYLRQSVERYGTFTFEYLDNNLTD